MARVPTLLADLSAADLAARIVLVRARLDELSTHAHPDAAKAGTYLSAGLGAWLASLASAEADSEGTAGHAVLLMTAGYDHWLAFMAAHAQAARAGATADEDQAFAALLDTCRAIRTELRRDEEGEGAVS